MNLEKLQSLKTLTISDLRDKFGEVMGYVSHSRNRPYLIRKILWGVQAQKFGDISPEARQHAYEIADFRDLHFRLPKLAKTENAVNGSQPDAIKVLQPCEDRRVPVPGSMLVRQYKGAEIKVMVMSNGFEYAGKQYRSL